MLREVCASIKPSNTGRHSETCLRIDQGFRKSLLFFACCHILEIFAGAAFKEVIGI